jgi:hypothetical protein
MIPGSYIGCGDASTKRAPFFQTFKSRLTIYCSYIIKGLYMKLLLESWRTYVNKLEEQKNMDDWAAEIQKNYKLYNQLNKEMAAAPEKHENEQLQARMQKIWNNIVKPYLDKAKEITDQSRAIDDSAELRQFLKTVYRPYIKNAAPTLMKFYKTTKAFKIPITKQYYNMILPRVKQDLDHARAMFKIDQQAAAAGKPLDVEALMDKINKQREASEAKTKELEAKTKEIIASKDAMLTGMKQTADDRDAAYKFLFNKLNKGFTNAAQRKDMKAMGAFKSHFSNFKSLHAAKKWDELIDLAKQWGMGH